MQKQKLRNNKIKGTNTKNMPMFILIGLIAMIIIIAVIYYVFLRYSPEQIITYSGYAIEGKTMAENLKSDGSGEIDQYLNLIEVKENDLLYKRLNSYYIGEDDKKEVDINYPMYINEGNTIFNISRNTKLITVNYEEVEGYPEFMLTGGVMYNGGDLTRADGNKYIFLKSEDEIYTNVQAIKIKTATNEYEIKEYSNIYFTEESITYYEMQDGYMEYKRIVDIDNNSDIEVNGQTLTYKTFLERLGIIQSEEQNVNSNDQVNEKSENTTIEENQIEEENNNNAIENETTEEEWQEGMWAKPEVSCTDFEADVYTIRTNLSVIDRAGVITRGVIFEISLDGRLNRRMQATTTGELEITGLQPDTTYEIVGIVYYNNESRVEVEEEFYTGSVTTKSIDTLGTIDFSFENGEIYSNKIELIHLKINNDKNEEVIKGISRLQLEIDGIEYRLSNDQVTQIKAGEEITYQTSETIESNSRIRYEITAFDKFGNELKEINNTGETITSKQKPTASIRATKQDVTEVNLEVKLTNKDNVTLESYRYEIINQSGDVVKNATLNDNSNTETLAFTDLDPNGYYQIIIYGDYDLENGEGKQANQELGRGSFVTRPIASLGYMQVKIDDKEVLQNSMDLGISIDSNQTDARLIAILDKVEVVIYDEGKNVINNDQSNEQEDNEENQNELDDQENKETEIKRITLSKEEVKLLKTEEEVEVNLDQLNSNTKYRIDVITTVKQGSVEEVVEDKQDVEEVITLKMPAEVQIRNQFVIGDMIDLDIRVEDIDNAVLTNSVRIEVRDEENKLINLSEMSTNSDYERKTYEGLEPETTYRIIIYAPQYNIGSTDKTYEADYILKEIEILTEAGISGKLDLLSLEKTPSGKNLIDVSSKVNWYEKCFGTSNAYGLNYDENTSTLILGGTSGYNKMNYYDLSKYLGQEITISFKSRSTNATQLGIIEKNTDDMTNTEFTTYYIVRGLTEEWQEYSYTITIDKTGYIGFYVMNANEVVEIRDLQIELGNTETNYEEFKYTYNVNIRVSVNDTRNEIITNDYYIRIYRNNEQVEETRYEELNEENKIENVLKTYEVDTDATYKIELLVKIGDRFYELDSQEFTTEGLREIKSISNENDFLKIQPYGEYIILNDLDLSGASNNNFGFGYNNLQFEGKIDFNGKTLTRDIMYYNDPIIYEIGRNALIENIVFDIKINNSIESQMMGGLARTNYGTIRNVQINVIESIENPNYAIFLMFYSNFGTVENFIVNLEEPIYAELPTCVYNNYGIMKNGYIYGENIKLINETMGVVGACVNTNQENGILENVYTLISVDNLYSSYVANLVRANRENATVQNVYSVKIGENVTDLSSGPNVGSKSSKKVFNNYYFADEIFTSELETKGNKLSLWDAEFQNQIINSDGAFIVDELVNEGYYPHLNMPDCMPLQEYIELPEVEDADLPDILSTKILEQGTDTVKVEFSVNNPSAETISDIQIENIDVEIISQEYKDRKSTVIAELKNPIICVSSYDLLSISTRGAFNSSYTRRYEEGERVINVDLYNEIWNVSDWKNINNSPSENYMLMNDLDFINEGNNICISVVRGIIDGGGHSLKNIRLDGDWSLIFSLYGTLENLYISNFTQDCAADGGVIRRVESGAVIDNVHLSNAKIIKTGSGNLGGIAWYSFGSSIRNSSINNIEIIAQENLSELNIGGLVGSIGNTLIENCYVANLKIKDSKAVNSAIGGLVGIVRSSSRIANSYTEGSISSDNSNVGGIVGTLIDGNLENCYSKINISTTNNNVGGIVGVFSDSDTESIMNNLSIGNIYTTSRTNNLNRIVGNKTNTTINNYSYEKQLLNGYESIEEKGATLLSKEEISNLDLGDSYKYDESKSGVLAKLYNSNGTDLLPNQKDIYIDNNGEDIDIQIENIEATKPNTTEAEIEIRINNPEEIEITGITIEDMNSTITRNVTQNGITNIIVRAIPNRFYDSYKLTEIKYKTNDAQDEQIKEVETEIIVQFYKEIYTYEDWQTIELGTYQNYRLMSDIDFSGRDNVKNNITVNRLEAENKVYTLKNITLEFNEANTGLINNIKTSMKNIKFENITLSNTINSGKYFGLIATNNGNLENVSFENIIINSDNMDNVGVIGGIISGNVGNVDLNDISIKGHSSVGGLIGHADLSIDISINNITANNITIEASADYVGGILGYNEVSSTIEMNNITIESSNITGKNYVGGIFGYLSYSGNIENLKTNNLEIYGNSYVGGVVGRVYALSDNAIFCNIQTISTTMNCTGSYIGGVAGNTVYIYIRYVEVSNTIINAPNMDTQYVGGISGASDTIALRYFQIDNIEIHTNGTDISGVLNNGGGFASTYFGYIINSTIQGNNNVGGVIGSSSYSSIGDVYVNANIKANTNTAGGVIGYLDNTNMSASSNVVTIYRTMVMDTSVNAPTKAGRTNWEYIKRNI